MEWLRGLFAAEKLTGAAREQRQRTLAIMLRVTMVGATAIGISNLARGNHESALSTFLLAAVVLLLIGVNSRGLYHWAATALTLVSLLVVHYNMFIGEGLHDSAVLAYPILLILGTLFFGKRAAAVLFLACCASMALIRYGEVVGDVLYPFPFSKHSDLITLYILLGSATFLVWIVLDHNEKNLQQIADSEAEIRLAYETTLEGWARALEIRDKETEGHSRRVTTLTVQLARKLGCSEEEIYHIRHGALLHDIGKLAIPDQILFKPGPLDEGERAIMNQHPRYALEMLETIDFLQPALSIPYCHHERWDGTGYPQGLKGEEIPLPARIFAVVDQWEALSSDRPYRPAWPREEIIAYLQKNRGTAFDPRIVDTFIQII